MGVKLKIVRNDFPKVTARTNARVEALTDQVRDTLLSNAKSAAPVDTGNLRDSGHIDGEDVIFDATNAVGEPYGGAVEFGTRFMAAQPFLTPAAEQVKPLLFGGLKRVIG